MVCLVDTDAVHIVEEFSFLIQISEVAILANTRPVAGFHSQLFHWKVLGLWHEVLNIGLKNLWSSVRYKHVFLYKDDITPKLNVGMHCRNLLDFGLRKKPPVKQVSSPDFAY